MSASEKLKALDEAISPPPWIRAVVVDYNKDETIHRVIALRNALPQIVELVEVAEALQASPTLRRHGIVGITPLDDALSALDEALTKSDRTDSEAKL